MNDIAFPELDALRIEISDEVRDEQFAAIVSALHVVAPARPSLLDRARAAWRRWVVSIAAVGTALVPVGAVASESAVPGDTLYPIKLAVERIQVLFDGDIDAEHRVDEIERMIDRRLDVDAIDRHLATTLDVLQETDRPDLVERFDRAVDDHRPEADSRQPADPTDDVPVDRVHIDKVPSDRATDQPVDERPDDDNPVETDQPNDTTTVPPHDQRPADETTTTTHGRSDEATTTTVRQGDRGDAGDDRGGDQPTDEG